MGLGKGDHGAKRFLNEKYPEVFTRFKDDYAALRRIGLCPDETAYIVDMNTVLMGTPQNVQSWIEYHDFFRLMILRNLKLANLLILNFDEPDHVPDTKWEEQERRDKVRKPSTSGDPFVPTDDRFDRETLHSLSRCSPLKYNRETRLRFIDELVSSLLLYFSDQPIVFDGVDPRGAARPFDAPREPRVVSTNAAYVSICERTHDADIGESDIKMAVNEEAVRAAIRTDHPLVRNILAIVSRTVDSDHLAVSFLHHARMHVTGTPVDVQSWLSVRETGQYASEQLARCTAQLGDPPLPPNPWSNKPEVGIAFVEIGGLHNRLMEELFGPNWREVDPAHRHQVARIFVAAWALAGCDFVKTVVRFDKIFNAFVHTVRTHGDTLDVGASGRWLSPSDAVRPVAILRWVLNQTTTTTASASSRARKVHVDPSTLLRAVWVSEYWNSNAEGPPADIVSWGFTPKPVGSPP